MYLEPAFIFDLDGTLVDSVYQHVLAWKDALDTEGIELSVWRIHRKIGMSGGIFTHQLLRETGMEISEERVERLQRQSRRGLPAPRACSQTAAGRARAAVVADRCRHTLGDRDQWPDGNRLRQPHRTRVSTQRILPWSPATRFVMPSQLRTCPGRRLTAQHAC